MWRVLWISSDYGDDGIGAKSKKFRTVSNTPLLPPPPKRINGLKINPPPAGPNTTTTTTTVTTKKQTELRGRHTRAPSDCQTTQENICQIFLPPQNFGIEKFKPKNILRFFPSLKIQSNLPRSPIPLPRA